MELDTSTWMMIFFIISLVVAIWKIYAFLPNKQLADDDTTKDSQEELLKVILKVIKKSDGSLTSTELFEKVKSNEGFDTKKFWRFNQNRLNKLLEYYHLQTKTTNSIKDIHMHELRKAPTQVAVQTSVQDVVQKPTQTLSIITDEEDISFNEYDNNK